MYYAVECSVWSSTSTNKTLVRKEGTHTHTLAQVQKNPHHPHISRDPHVTSTYCLYSISFWFLKYYYCTVQYILAKKKDHAPCVPLILVHGTRLAAHCYACVTHSIKTTSLKASVATHTLTVIKFIIQDNKIIHDTSFS